MLQKKGIVLIISSFTLSIALYAWIFLHDNIRISHREETSDDALSETNYNNLDNSFDRK